MQIIICAEHFVHDTAPAILKRATVVVIVIIINRE